MTDIYYQPRTELESSVLGYYIGMQTMSSDIIYDHIIACVDSMTEDELMEVWSFEWHKFYKYGTTSKWKIFLKRLMGIRKIKHCVNCNKEIKTGWAWCSPKCYYNFIIKMTHPSPQTGWNV